MNVHHKRKTASRSFVLLVGLIAIIALSLYYFLSTLEKNLVYDPGDTATEAPAGAPQLESSVLIEGLSNVWDVAIAHDGTVFFDERSGDISIVRDGQKQLLERPADVVSVGGEGGMMGMTLDPDFATNRYLYACFNTSSDVKVVRWRVSEDSTKLEERKDIITGIPRKNASGRHSGCRPRFGADGSLWVGTGDAADSNTPQNPTSLGGKILRVDRDGQSVEGNLALPFDARIFSYGHRNLQGLAMFSREKDGSFGYSVEHGPDKDDEVNALLAGNFGWAPGPGYNERVPMTDKTKFPEAIDALWSSGSTTIAPSGATILSGGKWGAWDGALAMAVLKGSHVRILTFDDQGAVSSESVVLDTYGRIRSVVLGPEGDLYLTTDNGGGADKIIRVTTQP